MTALLVGAASVHVAPPPADAETGSTGGSAIAWVQDGDLHTVESDLRDRRNLTEDVADVVTTGIRPQWSPDGRSVLVGLADSPGDDPTQLAVVDLDGTVTPIPGTENAFYQRNAGGFSPDGSMILFDRSTDLWVAPADGSAPATMVRDDGLRLRNGRWAPDGERVVANTLCCTSIDPQDSDAWVFDIDGVDDPLLISDAADLKVGNAYFLPGGDVVYSSAFQGLSGALVRAGGDGTDDHVNLTTAEALPSSGSARIAPGGNVIGFLSQGSPHVVPADDSADPTELLPGASGTWPAEPFDRAGEQIAFSTNRAPDGQYLQVDDLTDEAGPMQLSMPGVHPDLGDLSFSPDGTMLAVTVRAQGETDFRMWVTDLVNAPGSYSSPDATIDGTFVAWSPTRAPVQLFSDVPVDHPFFGPIEWMVEAGVTDGYDDGTFRPAGIVSRQAMAAFLFRLLGDEEFTPPATPTFTDVPTTSPFFTAVEWLASSGITGGYPDGTFRPGTQVGRQAMAAFLYRAAGEPPFTPPAAATFDDVPTTSPFFVPVELLSSVGVVGGFADGSFRPTWPVSRQAMAAFLSRFVDAPFPDDEE